MTLRPDPSTLSLPRLHSLDRALTQAITWAEASAWGARSRAVIHFDAFGASVIFSIPNDPAEFPCAKGIE